MRKFAGLLRNIKMTTAIVVLVILSITGSIAAVSTAIYLNLHRQAFEVGKQQQGTNLSVAATILERRLTGSVLSWTEGGDLEAFVTWSSDLPPFEDTEMIDSVTRVTRQDATIYAVDAATGSLVSKTTSLTSSSGARLTEVPLDPTSAPFASLMAGTRFVGEVDLDGRNFFGAFQPIQKKSGELLGALFVGTPIASVEASANGIVVPIATVGGGVTVVLIAVGLMLARLITRPIPLLAKSMSQIAKGDYAIDVPYTRTGNEVGEMARAVEVFRENGLRVSQMIQAEEARLISDQEDRKVMMVELQKAFGQVVEAAAAGNFKRQVTIEFPDPELNGLASSVNGLVSTFDRSVSEIGRVLGGIANTDLTLRMSGEYDGAFAQLKNDVNAVAERLTEVVGRLRSTSGSLKIATSEILAGSNDLSDRTVKQASTIEETSAAMEQLARTVQENSVQAHDANEMSKAVSRTAEDGGAVMEEATRAMEKISSSSNRISNIIGMIDDIAFQTNLLALNASVEAARAGDAGKGFAVVAVEVRRLAQSAAQASAEVKNLVDESLQDVATGGKLVLEAAGKLTSMRDGARSTSDQMERIAKNSRSQASAIDEISAAVRQLDLMTQHNVALVEETSAAIEQTEAQATELDRIVDVFRIAETEPRPTEVRGARVLQLQLSKMKTAI